jgi:cell division protein FtsB
MGQMRQPAGAPFRRRFPGLRSATLVMCGVLVWLILNVGSLRQFIAAYRQRNVQRDNVELVKEQIQELETQKQSLELGMFENEKSVREAYRLVRPGEKLILIKEEEKTSDSTRSLGAIKSR